MKTILITGMDSLTGIYVAHALNAAAPSARLVGLGRGAADTLVEHVEMLSTPRSGYEFADLLKKERVNVVIHLDIAGEYQPVLNREQALQQNILGGMTLLGACVTAGVQRVVVQSSTLVYGASPSVPLFASEQQPLTRSRPSGLLYDYVEIETFIANFRNRHPSTDIVVLRCAGLVGAGVWSPLSHYLTQPLPLTLVGFQPRVQVLHIEDAAVAFALAATKEPVSQVFNVAAERVVTLSRAIALAGRQPAQVPEFFFDAARRLLPGRESMTVWHQDRDFLKYSCVADIQRARRELGWSPQHGIEDALHETAAYAPKGKRLQEKTQRRVI